MSDSDTGQAEAAHDENGNDTPDPQAKENAGDASESDDEDESEDENGGKEKKSLFKKPLFWIILAVVAAILIIGGTLYYLDARQYESTDDAFVDAHIVRIAPQVAGTLIDVADVDNRNVEAGTLLAVIEPSGQQDQLAEAEANIRQAQEQYSAAQSQIDAAIASRQQAVAQAQAPLAAARKAAQDLVRYRQLVNLDPNAVAGQQLDQARANARQTAADAAAAQRQIDSADAAVTVARKQARVADATIAARRAVAEQNKTTIGNLRLTAPISGQVVNRSVNIGSYVAPGTQLMAIVPEKMWITANFKETQLGSMRVGQPVSISIDAYPNVEFRGRVDSFQRGAGQAFALLPPQNSTGNYVKVVQRVPVRIVFDTRDNPDPRKYPIGPGMSAVPTVKVR